MKYILIDGNSIINRAFYGIRLFSNKDGQYTNAVYGFLNIMLKLIDDEKPDGLCVAFDVHAPTFRVEKYAEYKANRTGMPDELAAQMPVLKDILTLMEIPIFEAAGYEADDLLGTLAKRIGESGNEAVVVTGDRDSLQLVCGSTRVKLVTTAMGQTKTTDYTPEVFEQEYGFGPCGIIDLKALMGDSSDNIPGVSGVGKKTATDLITRFKTLDEVYSNLEAEEIKPAVRKKLEAGRDMAYLSYDLATIDCDVPVEIDIGGMRLKEYDKAKLYDYFVKLEFRSLIDKMGLSGEGGATAVAAEAAKLEVTRLSPDSVGLIDAMPTPVAMAYCDSMEAFALCDGKRILAAKQTDFTGESYNALLKRMLSPDFGKIVYDAKRFYELAGENLSGEDMGHSFGVEFDVALGAYLLDPTAGSYTPEKLALSHLKREIPPCSVFNSEEAFSLLGGGLLENEAGSDALDALCVHAQAAYELYGKIKPEIEKLGMAELYYSLELPLCGVLHRMEKLGMLVDRGMLQSFSATLTTRIDELTKSIYVHAGGEFNINSTKLLGEVLFERLELPTIKKTKTGFSTDIEVLEKLKGRHPIIEEIIEYRELTKLRSTYCDGLLKVIGPDGRIHSKFNMMVTATGRLSSTEPNLQNIPVRRELGSEIRKMFVAREGCVFVDADYSQIELRVLAHIADDRAMIDAFLHGDDIHTITASQVFGVPPDEVTGELRRRAKAVNFGIVYGISDFSLADDLGVSRAEAKSYIESYLGHYSGIARYMKEVVEKAKEDGYVTTLMNRRRYLPELTSRNFNIRSFGERAAMNTPIQGSAADIIKLAMLKVDRRLGEEGLKSRLVLQVHDELIVEAPEDEAERVSVMLTEEMESVMSLKLPLKAEAKTGKSWFDAK